MTNTSRDKEYKRIGVSLAEARDAQASWALQPISARLLFVRDLRHLVAVNAAELASATAAVSERPPAEKLASKALPLADACRWLDRRAARVFTAALRQKRPAVLDARLVV